MANQGDNRMGKDTYTLLNKFNCCGKIMVIVIIKEKAACVMTEKDYNRIIKAERRHNRANKYKIA